MQHPIAFIVLRHLIGVEINQTRLNIPPAPMGIMTGDDKALGRCSAFIHIQDDQFCEFDTLVESHISHGMQRTGNRKTLQSFASREGMLPQRTQLFARLHPRQTGTAPKSGTLNVLYRIRNHHTVQPVIAFKGGKADPLYRNSAHVRRNHDIRSLAVRKTRQRHTAAVVGEFISAEIIFSFYYCHFFSPSTSHPIRSLIISKIINNIRNFQNTIRNRRTD